MRQSPPMKNIVILISGGGSNMAAIVRASQQQNWAKQCKARIAAVISHKADAKGLAFAHVVECRVVRTARLAQPAHAMGEARRAEPDLRHLQPLADAEQDVLGRNFKPVELQLTMADVLLRPHNGDAPRDAPATRATSWTRCSILPASRGTLARSR